MLCALCIKRRHVSIGRHSLIKKKGGIGLEDITKELRNIVGNHVFTSKEEIIPFLSDASYFTGDVPYVVVAPDTAEQVSKIMTLCYQTGTPVVVRGGGTSLTGASILKGEGIIISMNRFDRILETSVEDKYVVAEPGVRLEDLNQSLGKLGHFYPPDPASSRSATVGGSLSTNAGGLRAAMYGTTKNWVLGMEAVMPDGTIVQLGGKTLKRTAGYDLASLMVGAEGTLGIITKAILKIWPVPEKKGRAVAYYKSIEPVGEAVSELKRKGITPMIAEFMDELTMNSLRRNKGMTFPDEAKYMLIVDVASTRESVERELSEVAEVLKGFEPIDMATTTDEKEMEILYEARKGAFASLLTERQKSTQRVVIGDIVVPASHLAEALSKSKKRMEELGIHAGMVGHVGDGNIHANIYADLEDEEEMARVEKFHLDFGAIAVNLQGSVSAEHGIGMEKIDLLVDEFARRSSPGTLEIMKKIKEALDPKDLLNRGKLFRK